MIRHRIFATGLLFLLASLGSVASAQESSPEKSVLWSLGFDDDIFGGSDDFFTGGWSLQRHGPAVASWDELNLSKPSRWIADWVPGLSGGQGQRFRRGIGLNQIIQTPEDLGETELIVDDVPYAGVLGLANSWAALSNDRINVFQIYLGMLGPVSMAEEVQTFLHTDLGLGTDPMGWDNQLGNELVVNLNYMLSRKIGRVGSYQSGFGADLAYTGDVGLGNLFTQAQVGLQARLGWRLSEGFAQNPDIAGRGVFVDPVLSAPPSGKTRFYFSAGVRGALLAYTVLLDGNTFQDSHSVDYDHYFAQILLGAHCERGALGIHFTLYFSSNPVQDLMASEPSWGNLSVGYRF
jgi:hypothetical protein